MLSEVSTSASNVRPRRGITPNRRKKSLETRAPSRSCGSSIPVSTNVWLNVRKAATVSNERLSFWMSRKRAGVTPTFHPRRAEKSEMATICFASLYGGGRNKTAFMTENAAVPIPIAKASTRPAKNVGIGFPLSQRTESRSTCRFKRDSAARGGRLGEKSYDQPLSPVCSANSSDIRFGRLLFSRGWNTPKVIALLGRTALCDFVFREGWAILCFLLFLPPTAQPASAAFQPSILA